MRLTEYHAGAPVIRDTKLLPEAMKKLAKLEDLEDQGDIREAICDEYCRHRHAGSQPYLDYCCSQCKLAGLFEMLD